MSDDIDGPEWDPPELLDSDAPEIYVAGPGRVQQWLRTLSAVIAVLALVMGVLIMADESAQQTDLMNDQNELIRQQIVYNDCKDQVMAQGFVGQILAITYGADGTSTEWREDGNEYMQERIDYCFPDGIFGDE